MDTELLKLIVDIGPESSNLLYLYIVIEKVTDVVMLGIFSYVGYRAIKYMVDNA